MISVSRYLFSSWLEILGYVVSEKSAGFFFIVSIDMENALLVTVEMNCTDSVHTVNCFSQQHQDVRMNKLFCVNAYLCCSSVSSPNPAISSCRAIRMRHTLRS